MSSAFRSGLSLIVWSVGFCSLFWFLLGMVRGGDVFFTVDLFVLNVSLFFFFLNNLKDNPSYYV